MAELTPVRIFEKLPFLQKRGAGENPCKYVLKNQNGEGQMLVYDAVPGVELALILYSGAGFQFHHPVLEDVLQINYCLEGRMGWIMKNGSSLYLGSGDLSMHLMECCAVSNAVLPLNYYKGISVFVDLAYLTQNPPEALQGLGITASGWRAKFCGGGDLTVLPDVEAAAEIFASMPLVKEDFLSAYFKLKAQELLLFLEMLDMGSLKQAESYEKQYTDTVKKIHARLTADWQKRYTIESLAKEYLINPSLLKKVFKTVYGQPVAQYMKEYRMHKAAALLLKSSGSVAEIAAEAGYSSQSKFAAAFKQVMQLAPAEYRARYGAKQ